jgi:hypothetical protein
VVIERKLEENERMSLIVLIAMEFELNKVRIDMK